MEEHFTLAQMDFLVKYFDDRYNEKFVHVDDCNEIQERVNKKFANDDKRIELLIHQQKINNWLTGAIASGIIALLIKVFIGG